MTGLYERKGEGGGGREETGGREEGGRGAGRGGEGDGRLRFAGAGLTAYASASVFAGKL